MDVAVVGTDKNEGPTDGMGVEDEVAAAAVAVMGEELPTEGDAEDAAEAVMEDEVGVQPHKMPVLPTGTITIKNLKTSVEKAVPESTVCVKNVTDVAVQHLWGPTMQSWRPQ